MITLWLNKRVPPYFTKSFDNGFVNLSSVNLSYVIWFGDLFPEIFVKIKVDMESLDKGYEI